MRLRQPGSVQQASGLHPLRRVRHAPLTYLDKLRSFGPVALWAMQETAGTTALCQVNASQNGTYDGATLAEAAGPLGTDVAPLLDGTNDDLDVYSPTLDGAASKTECTLVVWLKMASGVWTDGATRRAFQFEADGSNYINMEKAANDGYFGFNYSAGGTLKQVLLTGQASLDWRCYALRVSAAEDTVKAYIDGVQVGATRTGLGTWTGSFGLTTTVIGAAATWGLFPFSGHIAYVVYYPIKTEAEILQIATP